MSKIADRSEEEICRKAGTPLLLASSIKAGLDIDWSDAKQKATAIEIVERQVSSLHRWVEEHLDRSVFESLTPYIQAIVQVQNQDLEKTETGTTQIRDGVAPDRRIPVEDAQMRHGRKSKTKRFDGYKEHIARDLDLPLVVACSVTPANRPEEEGAAPSPRTSPLRDWPSPSFISIAPTSMLPSRMRSRWVSARQTHL